MNLAWLGMGIMGSAMAANCLKAGHSVTVYNRTPSKCEPLREAGAGVAASPAEAARGKDSILICVEDTADVEQVLFGKNGVIEGLESDAQPPVLVIDHSTISPAATADFAKRLRERAGAMYLDAPVSGGDVGARNATLAIMCGGPAEAFARARPALEAMGKTIIHVGERNGDGQRAKLINQMVVAVNCVATTEAMRFCELLGMNAENVMAAISQGAAASWSLSNLGPKWLRRDFAPGFRLRHLRKDAGYCRESIEAAGTSADEDFPGLTTALRMIDDSIKQGHGDENILAMARLFEDKR